MDPVGSAHSAMELSFILDVAVTFEELTDSDLPEITFLTGGDGLLVPASARD